MPFDLNTAKPVTTGGFDLATAKPPARTVPSGPNKGLTREQLEARLAQQETASEQARARAARVGEAEPAGIALDMLGRGARTLLSPITGAVDLALDTVRSRPKYPSGSYEEARDAQIGEPAGATRRLLQPLEEGPVGRGITAALEPVGEAVESGIGGIATGLETVGLDPQAARNVAASGVDVGFEALGLRAGGVGKPARPKPAAKGAEAELAGREVTGKVTDTLPKGGQGALGMARGLGLKIPPSFAAVQPERIGQKAAGLTRQRLAGPGTLARFQVENQKIVNRGIAKEVGLKPDQPLAAQIRPALDQHNRIAQQVANTVRRIVPDDEFVKGANALGERVRNNPVLGNNPQVEKLRDMLVNAETLTGQQALDAIRQWRKNAKVALQSIDDFDKHELGRAMKEAANVLEGALERAATEAGQPRLVNAFRQSRVRAAKLHDIDNALIGDNIDLSVLAAAGPENLSGALQQFARVQQEFPQLTRTQSKITPDSGALSLAFSPITLGTQRVLGKKIVGGLLSEDFQRQFGDIVPEDAPKGIATSLEDVFDPPPVQSDAFGGPFEFEPPSGGAGGQMPSDARRLGSTVDRQADAFGTQFEFEMPPGDVGGPRLGPEDPLAGVRPGPNQGPPLTPQEVLELELAPQFLERRTADMPYTGIDRRVNGVPDLSVERQRVLDRPIGTPPNVGIADQLLTDPRIKAGAQADTLAGRAELNVGDQLPVGGIEPANVPGPIVPETGDFVRRRNVPEPEMSGFGPVRQNADVSDMIGSNELIGDALTTSDASVQAAINQLRDLGFSDLEIAEILARGQ